MLIQNNTCCKTFDAFCELNLNRFRDKLLYNFDYVPAKQHITDYILGSPSKLCIP